MSLPTIDDLATGQLVLCRLDLNSPVEDGTVRDNRRFDRHAETVRDLLDDGHAVVCLAHQGRPGDDDFVSLRQHAGILAEHVGENVSFVPEVCGDVALEAVDDLDGGDALLLENVRMHDDELPERSPEECADTDLVSTLAGHADAYVNDAYSAAHRSHASLVGFPLVLPSYAGRVMVAEYEANTAIANRTFDGRVTMVCGGTKAADVVSVMRALGDRVDEFLLGGVAGELFLRADGHDVGFDLADTDRFDDQWAETEDDVRVMLSERGEAVTLPTDLAYEDAAGERAEVAVAEIGEKDTAYLDVGERTVEDYADVVGDSAAVFVKGALGVFEDERFSRGTVGVLEAIAETDCFSVVGGGDTSGAIDRYGLDESDFSHVSIAGGAYIRALTGEELPAIAALRRGA